MKNLLTLSLVAVMLVAPGVLYAGGAGCRRAQTAVQCQPSPSSYNNGGVRSALGDLVLLDAICARRQESDPDREVLTTLLPIILQILQNPPAPPEAPQVLLVPDAGARTSFRVTSTSNQIKVPPRLIPTIGKYAELKTKFAKQPNGKVVKYYELGKRKVVPVSRSRYPRS
jgi:hypothetical protein